MQLKRARSNLQNLKKRQKLRRYHESGYGSNDPRSFAYWDLKNKEEIEELEQSIPLIELDILTTKDEAREIKIENKKEFKEKYLRKKGTFIKSSDLILESSNELNTYNEESSKVSFLFLALLSLPLMIFSKPLAFLSYGLLTWLWLGTWTVINIFLVCTTAYLYSSGNIFLGSLMLFMISVIFFIKLRKEIGSPSLSSMEGPARFKYKKRRIAAAIIWLFFCLLLSYTPSFVFAMVLIAIPFFAGYFIYAIANNLK
jgi:hypothetical protein|tara:strand:+ start:587 stop:1354 length:768 start_codon:yes stop_codon:yes gene_type:complete